MRAQQWPIKDCRSRSARGDSGVERQEDPRQPGLQAPAPHPCRAWSPPAHESQHRGQEWRAPLHRWQVRDTTQLTLGRYSDMDAYICADLGLEFREVVVYNYSIARPRVIFRATATRVHSSSRETATCSSCGTQECPEAYTTMLPTVRPSGGLSSRIQILIKYPFAEFYGMAYTIK